MSLALSLSFSRYLPDFLSVALSLFLSLSLLSVLEPEIKRKFGVYYVTVSGMVLTYHCYVTYF